MRLYFEEFSVGQKVIIDLAELKVPFLFTCTVTSTHMIREQPETVRRMAEAIAAGVHSSRPTRKRPSRS